MADEGPPDLAMAGHFLDVFDAAVAPIDAGDRRRISDSFDSVVLGTEKLPVAVEHVRSLRVSADSLFSRQTCSLARIVLV